MGAITKVWQKIYVANWVTRYHLNSKLPTKLSQYFVSTGCSFENYQNWNIPRIEKGHNAYWNHFVKLVKIPNSKVIVIQKSNLNNFECLLSNIGKNSNFGLSKLAKIKLEQFWIAGNSQKRNFSSSKWIEIENLTILTPESGLSD